MAPRPLRKFQPFLYSGRVLFPLLNHHILQIIFLNKKRDDMAERDDADPGSPRNQPDENQPDEPPCVQEILRAIRDDLHGSRSMIESIYRTFTA